MDDLDKLTLIINECRGIIDFNGLLLVGSAVMLLPIWCVNCYSCHLWGTHLIYVVVVHHMDDASLMDNVGLMDDGDFSPLQLPHYSCHHLYGYDWNMKDDEAKFIRQ